MFTPMTRWRASGMHLLITVLVMASVAGWIIAFWYPPALFKMAGADRLLLLLGLIDLVAGPLLTLIIYRHGKRGLQFDLTVIGLAQAGLLAYGLSVIWESRPVFLVAVHDRFDLVFANQIDPHELAKAARPEWRRLSFAGPQLVGAKGPDDPEQQAQVIFEALAGRDIPLRPQFYVAFSEIAPQLIENSRPLNDDSARAELRQALQAEAFRLKRPADELRYVPIASKRGFATMLIDAKTGTPTAPLSLDPWSD